MYHFLCRRAAAIALGLPLLAAAQGRPDVTDPKAPARALAYRSAFADYKPYQDTTPGDWRLLNATVGRAALKPSAAVSESGPPPAAPVASAPAAKAPMPHTPGHHQPPQGGRQ